MGQRLADEVRDADGGAAAGEEATLTLGQREVGRGVGDADVRGARELEPAAHHRALERRDDGHAPVFHLVEGLVPAQADLPELGGRAVGTMVFHQVQPGAEVVPGRREHDGPRTCGLRTREEPHEFLDGGGIQRVALGRAVEGDHPHAVRVTLDEQVEVRVLHRIGHRDRSRGLSRPEDGVR